MKNITMYQLNCGHVQRKIIGADTVELYKEHSMYHVRRHAQYVDDIRKVNETWFSFFLLSDAQKAFKRQYDIAKAINKRGAR